MKYVVSLLTVVVIVGLSGSVQGFSVPANGDAWTEVGTPGTQPLADGWLDADQLNGISSSVVHSQVTASSDAVVGNLSIKASKAGANDSWATEAVYEAPAAMDLTPALFMNFWLKTSCPTCTGTDDNVKPITEIINDVAINTNFGGPRVVLSEFDPLYTSLGLNSIPHTQDWTHYSVPTSLLKSAGGGSVPLIMGNARTVWFRLFSAAPGNAGHKSMREHDFEFLVDGLHFSDVPEPATLLLLTTGSAALLARRRRSRQ